MGDFERTFGAGADADAIIDAFSASAARERDDAEEEILDSGKHLPQAKSFFDLTGQVWHPAPDPQARLSRQRLAEINQLADDVLKVLPGYAGEWAEVVKSFLVHTSPALEKLSPSLDAFEVFLSRLVRKVDFPLVFARDTSPNSGYVSRTLSTHILAFPEEFYLARFGDLELDGPFSDFEFCGGWAVSQRDSYCNFANERPGREVLEISDELRSPEVPIRTVRDWVNAQKGMTSGQTSFCSVARRAASRTPRCRSWSNAAEDALRARVRAILAGFLPGEAEVTVMLNVWTSKLSGGIGRTDQVPAEVIWEILDRVDVSLFRGAAPTICLLEISSLTARERIAGREVFLEFLEEIGVDASAAADALERRDYAALLQIISPEEYNKARRSTAEQEMDAEAFEDALTRNGLAEDEVPF